MKATHILWDTDGDEQLFAELPSELYVPEELKNNEDAISDWLTETTGFCHKGFLLESDTG